MCIAGAPGSSPNRSQFPAPVPSRPRCCRTSSCRSNGFSHSKAGLKPCATVVENGVFAYGLRKRTRNSDAGWLSGAQVRNRPHVFKDGADLGLHDLRRHAMAAAIRTHTRRHCLISRAAESR